jgi:hypothetical protein
MTVEWHGERILRQAERIVETNEAKAARRIEKEAKRLCPVGDFERAARPGQKAWKSRKPGKLKNAIKSAQSKFKDGGWIVYVPGQGSETYYVRWVELGAPARSDEQWKDAGHAHPVPRQPFLRPALEREKKKYLLGVKMDLFRRWAG